MVEWCGNCAMEIWSYCLMPNHTHLIAVPSDADNLSSAIGEATLVVFKNDQFQGRLAGLVVARRIFIFCHGGKPSFGDGSLD
jgi:REP element-mobilizing transposase RayT